MRVLDSRIYLGDGADLARPGVVEPGVWRRAGALARMALHVGLPLVWPAPQAILWATGLGELDAVDRFFGRLAEDGPALLSAAAFQTSLPGTAGALLSIAAAAYAPGWTGPVETFAGADAGSQAWLRAEILLELGRFERVLLVAADVPHAVALAAGVSPGVGGALALLLAPDPRVTDPA